jgi:eukaryotic-like serine/threonine-protein kinase
VPLSAGTRLGPYEILSALGAGGMGEVYRARDTKLDRAVAIKILPEAFAADTERIARFQREAKTLASLNHPNIAHIHDLEESNGVRALVMELVEGEDLSQRIARGAIPVAEALPIAKQMADALEAAHEQGIIHRDLKPANIKVRPDGTVKVLDFGLAKAMTGDIASPDLTNSPTETNWDTRHGVILGTAAYMSPEQARGKPVDKRADIWAFGCVLFEMLTRRAPFARETLTDTLAAIVERDPGWDTLPRSTPDRIRELMRRCLQKDPQRRLRDIGDARHDLDDAIAGATHPTALAVAPSSRLPWAMAAIGGLVTIVAVGALAWIVLTQDKQTAPRISRTTIAASGATAVTPNGNRSLVMTPDGTRIIYVGGNGRQLFVRMLDRVEAMPVTASAVPINWVFASPDGESIGWDEGGTLKKIAVGGGPAVTIVNTGSAGSFGATWAPDDTIIFATLDSATGLQRVSAGGGEVTLLTRPAAARGESAHIWPEMLPGGRGVLFTISAVAGGLDAAQIAVFDLATGSSKVLLGGSDGHYVATGQGARVGHLVFTAGGTLRAVAFDIDRLETRGMPVTVLPRIIKGRSGAGDFDVASDGTLAYVEGPDFGQPMTSLVWVDRQGREERVAAPVDQYSLPRVSPDGKRLALALSTGIRVWDMERKAFGQATLDTMASHSPLWSRDGQRIFFFGATRSAGLLWQAADGTSPAERLASGLPTGVTPDGQYVLFSSAPGSRDVMLMTLDAAHTTVPLIQTPAQERNGVVSRDGRWVAYESDSSGRFEIYVRPFPNVSSGQWNVSTAGGTRPLWAPNGDEIFFVAPDGAIMAVPVTRGSTWQAGEAATVVEARYLTQGAVSTRTYDVSADGKRFLMVKPLATDSVQQIVIVQNWFEDLKRLVPTN